MDHFGVFTDISLTLYLSGDGVYNISSFGCATIIVINYIKFFLRFFSLEKVHATL
jgi:hypothetical protein